MSTATLTPFFSKLSARLQTREKTTAKLWSATVVALCDGKPPTVEAVEQLLLDADKTQEDLQAAVDRLHKRRLAARATALAKSEPGERARAEASYQAAVAARDAAVEKANRELQATVEPLQARIRELDQIKLTGEKGVVFLVDSFEDDGALDAQIEEQVKLREEAKARRGEHATGAAKAARTAGECGEMLSEHRGYTSLPTTGEWRRKYEQDLERATADEREHLAAIGPIDSEIAELERSIRQLEEKKLFP